MREKPRAERFGSSVRSRKGQSLRDFGRSPELLQRLGLERPAQPARTPSVKRAQEKNKQTGDDFLRVLEDGALAFSFPGATLLSQNRLLRTHDAQATGYKRQWKDRVCWLVLEHRALVETWKRSSPPPYVMESIMVRRDGKRLDIDGAVGGLKYVVDGLVQAKVMVDDTQDNLLHSLPFTVEGSHAGLLVVLRPSPLRTGYLHAATLQVAELLGAGTLPRCGS